MSTKAGEAQNICTTDACAEAVCAAAEITCPDDGSVCTDDICDPTTGQCGVIADPLPPECTPNCSADEDCMMSGPCILGASCVAGFCIYDEVDCMDDGDPCTDDVCDPATGECGILIDPPPAEGQGGCTSDADCDDGDPCTDDSCNLETGQCEVVEVTTRAGCGGCDPAECAAEAGPCREGSCVLGFCYIGPECPDESEPICTPSGCGGCASSEECDACDDSGQCVYVDNAPVNTPCEDDADECTAELCTGSGSCATPSYEDECDNLGPEAQGLCGKLCAGEPAFSAGHYERNDPRSCWRREIDGVNYCYYGSLTDPDRADEICNACCNTPDIQLWRRGADEGVPYRCTEIGVCTSDGLMDCPELPY